MASITFYIVKNSRLDKNTCAITNVIMLITKRALYTIYYREDEVVKNIMIKYELTKTLQSYKNLGKNA